MVHIFVIAAQFDTLYVTSFYKNTWHSESRNSTLGVFSVQVKAEALGVRIYSWQAI